MASRILAPSLSLVCNSRCLIDIGAVGEPKSDDPLESAVPPEFRRGAMVDTGKPRSDPPLPSMIPTSQTHRRMGSIALVETEKQRSDTQSQIAAFQAHRRAVSYLALVDAEKPAPPWPVFKTHRRWNSAPNNQNFRSPAWNRRSRLWGCCALTLLILTVAIFTVVTAVSMFLNDSKEHGVRDLSSALDYRCQSIWKQSYSQFNKTCHTLKSAASSPNFTDDVFVLGLSLPGSAKLNVQQFLPRARHVGHLTLDAKEAEDEHSRTLLHLKGLMMARDHMALHRGPRFALLLEDTAVPVSSDRMSSIVDELSTTLASLPDDWTVLQLGVSSAQSPSWAWSALRDEWLHEGRPRIAVAPASLRSEYFGGTIAYLVHERGVEHILNRVQGSNGAMDLSKVSRCSGCKPSQECSTYCLYTQERVLLSTPPLFKTASGALSFSENDEPLKGTNEEHISRWAHQSYLARQTRLLEPALQELLKQRAASMRNLGSCPAHTVQGIRLPQRRKQAGWVVYSNPGADIGDQLQGALSSWLLSLLLCRRFAGVLWDGSWAMDIFKVFGHEYNHHTDLEIVQGRGGAPQLHIEGIELSSYKKKTVLSWHQPCSCSNSHKKFFEVFHSLQDLDPSSPIEVVSDCSFLDELNKQFIKHPVRVSSQAYSQELNLAGVLSALLLKPTPQLHSLMPDWALAPLLQGSTTGNTVVGVRPMQASTSRPLQLLLPPAFLDLTLQPASHTPAHVLSCVEQLAASPGTKFVATGGSRDFLKELEKRVGKDRVLPSRHNFSSYEALPTGFEQFEMAIVWSLVDYLTLSVAHVVIADADDSLDRVAAMASHYRFTPKTMDVPSPHSGYVLWDYEQKDSSDQCFLRNSLFQLKPRRAPHREKRSQACTLHAKRVKFAQNRNLVSRVGVPVTKHPWWATLHAICMGVIFTVLIAVAAIGSHRGCQLGWGTNVAIVESRAPLKDPLLSLIHI
eukprot:TRINITY_DN5037_c0_g1_i1.p1 TRINITY_DN5037_c0_g1~~TRINITY_DN5037_c0_g1_i1.p1  ORF type:complete len:964 (-),score=155.25 TRINITY_DN5037_c0_g1_i1:133-3024(-)